MYLKLVMVMMYSCFPCKIWNTTKRKTKPKVTVTVYDIADYSPVATESTEDNILEAAPEFTRVHPLTDDKTHLILVKNIHNGKFGVEKISKGKQYDHRLWKEWFFINSCQELKIKGIIKCYHYVSNGEIREASSYFMEYCNGGDLFDYIDNIEKLESYSKGSKIDKYIKRFPQILNIALQLSHTLNKLHTHNMIHFDIKPDNILIKKDHSKIETVLADFEFCEILGHNQPDSFYKSKGTVSYVDPELMSATKENRVSGKPCDVYSLGVTLWCVAFHSYPYYASDAPWQELPIQYHRIAKDKFVNLLIDMIACPQYKRPTMNEVYNRIKEL